MNLIQALLLSVVEGITEFLPVSSTGHLIVVSRLLSVPQTAFTTSFEIFIQLGAILAVIILYGKKALRSPAAFRRLGFAFVPTAVIGFLLYKVIKTYLFGNPWVVVISLGVGGGVMIAIEMFFARHPHAGGKTMEECTDLQAVSVGLFQSLSMIPGVSRAAATIIGGQLIGFSRSTAVEFSFLLSIPTMIAATGLDLVKSRMFSFTSWELILMGVGFFGSFVTALTVIRVFLRFIQGHSFIPFGIYRIVLAVAYAAVVLR